MIKTQLQTVLFVAAVTLLGLVINDYRYGIWDQAFYIPMIEHAADPTLFSHDYMFDRESGLVSILHASVVESAIAALTRFFSLEYILFTAYLIGQFCLFGAIYTVSWFLFKSRGAATLAVLLLLIPDSVAGSGTWSQEIYFTYRGFAMPLTLAFLVPYYSGRLLLAATLCGMILVLHPPSAMPVVCLLFLRLLLAKRRHWKVMAGAVGILLAFSLPRLMQSIWAIWTASAASDGGVFSVAPEWVEMMRVRQPYFFVSDWSRDAFLSMGAYLGVLIAILSVRTYYGHTTSFGETARVPSNTTAFPVHTMDFWTLVVVFFWTLVLLAEFVLLQYPVLLAVRHNLHRGFHLVMHLSMMYVAWFLWHGFQAGMQRLPNSGTRDIRRLAALLIPTIGLLVCAVAAVLFASDGYDQLLVGSVILVGWILAAHTAQGSASAVLNPWRVLAATAWLAAVIVLRESIFHASLIRMLNLPVVRAALLASSLVVLAAWATHRYGLPWRKYVTSGGLVATTILGILLAKEGALQRVRASDQFTEYVQLPGVPLRSNWTLPGGIPYNDWIDVGRWSRMNSPADALFFVPPDLAEFRIHSQRGIVGDWEDGGVVNYSRRFAEEWWDRHDGSQGL